jgi:hypothetical protein
VAIALAAAGWLVQLWVIQRRIRAMAHAPPAAIGRTLPGLAIVAFGYAVLGIVLVATA